MESHSAFTSSDRPNDPQTLHILDLGGGGRVLFPSVTHKHWYSNLLRTGFCRQVIVTQPGYREEVWSQTFLMGIYQNKLLLSSPWALRSLSSCLAGGLITLHGRFTEEDTLPTGQTPPNAGAGHGALTTSNVNGVIYGFFIYPVQ